MSPVERDPAPRDIHGRRIRNADDSDCSGLPQCLPTLSRGLVVRGQCRRNIGPGTTQQDGNLPLQIQTSEVVIVLLRDFQPVSYKNQRRLHFIRTQIHACAEVGVFAQAERLFGAIADKRSRRLLFDDLS